ncbi:MAG: hypothetical protein EOP21_06985, partial [Hyphomicrobiales bacterium]
MPQGVYVFTLADEVSSAGVFRVLEFIGPMFDTLSDRLGGVFDKLRGRGALKEQDVRDAMR